MEAYLAFIWLGIVMTAFIVEASTSALVAIWFVPAALISMTLSFFSVPLPVQIIVFLTLSGLFIFISFKFLKQKIETEKIATNVDSIIGENAVVIEEIDNLAYKGQVKVRGQVWTARSYDENVKYDKDDVLKIIAIEGVKVIVKKEEDKEKSKE